MKKNMSVGDRVIRSILALAFLVPVFANIATGLSAVILIILSIVCFGTASIGFCPIYRMLNLKTLHLKKSSLQ
jgi:hypothetical protein